MLQSHQGLGVSLDIVKGNEHKKVTTTVLLQPWRPPCGFFLQDVAVVSLVMLGKGQRLRVQPKGPCLCEARGSALYTTEKNTILH